MENINTEKGMVSAVITTHNRVNYLRKAIESVLSQDYENMECIVVDDASDIDVEEAIKDYIDNYQVNLIKISKQESCGGNHARNVGIQASKGEYIAFLDDDDQWYSDKIRKQMELVLHSKCDFCYCGLQMVDVNENTIYYSPTENMKSGNLAKEILLGVVCTTSAILVKKSVLYVVGLFDEKLRFWQEYDLCIRLFQLTNVAALRECRVKYMVNPSDKARLTNNLIEWEKMVPMFEKKHETLIDTLTAEEKKIRKLFIVEDALQRSRLSGDKSRYKKYMRKRFGLTKNIKDYVKALLCYGFEK